MHTYLIWDQLDRVKRIWYLSPMRAAKVQASLRIRAVSPEPPLLAHTSSESRGTFRQKARSLALLNGLACAVKICHDGMLEDTNSLDGAQFMQHYNTPTNHSHAKPAINTDFSELFSLKRIYVKYKNAILSLIDSFFRIWMDKTYGQVLSQIFNYAVKIEPIKYLGKYKPICLSSMCRKSNLWQNSIFIFYINTFQRK